MNFFYEQDAVYTPFLENEKIRIVFLFQIASFWPSWESFYYECQRDNRFDVKFLYLNYSAIGKEQMESAESFLKSKKIEYIPFKQFDLQSFKPHVAVYQSPYDALHREPEAMSLRLKWLGCRILYIPYGIEIVDTGEARLVHFCQFSIKNSWRIYTLSDEMLQEYWLHCTNRRAVRAMGVPKFDSYYHKESYQLSSTLKRRIAGRKIVLWKVHFPKMIYENGRLLQVTPYLGEYIKFVEYIKDHSEMFFIFRPHPLFLSPTTVKDVLREEANKLLKGLDNVENVYIDTSDDYRNSLLNADAIIIDRSAIMVEAAVVGVPVLYMSNPDFFETLTKPIAALVKSYEQGNSVKDMVKFLDVVKTEKDSRKSERLRAMKKCLPYFDGKAGQRIKDDIVTSLIEEQYKIGHKKKLVLFGLGMALRFFLDYTNLLHNKKYEIVAFSDNDSPKWGTRIENIEVVAPEKLRDYEYDFIIITSEQYHVDIKKHLVYDVCLDEDKIVRMDAFAVGLMQGRE